MTEEVFDRCQRCEKLDMCEYRFGFVLCPECLGALAKLVKAFILKDVELVRVDQSWLQAELRNNGK